MDDETADLIASLCTRVGIIMEEASVLALTMGSLSHAQKLRTIHKLEAAGTKFARLIAATKALASDS